MADPIKLKFTDFWTGEVSGKVENNPIYKMLRRHFDVVLSDDPDFLIYDSNGYQFLKYDCIRIFYTGENRRPNFKQCDYAFSFDYPVSERNYRLPLYRLWRGYARLLEPRQPATADMAARKFCCFLASKPIPTRDAFFQLLSAYRQVDAGGGLFNNISGRVPRGGEVDWMGGYKFSIVFENASHPGYTTEKILNAFLANTVPIYWGNPLVSQDFNPEAMINCHDYESFDQVVQAIRELDQDDARYLGMLSEPFLPGGEETDFCREENIVGRFAQIFSQRKAFIPAAKKRRQRINLVYYQVRNALFKRLRRKR